MGILDQGQVAIFLDAVVAMAEPVETHFTWRPQLRDPCDELVLERVSGVITELTQKSSQQQEGLRATVEQRLDALRIENTEKLEGIRQTVDEKLQSTLNERLGPSFQVVSEWLERVHKSMGEMQNLANGSSRLLDPEQRRTAFFGH